MPSNDEFSNDMARLMRQFPRFLYTTPEETFLFPRQEAATTNVAEDGANDQPRFRTA